MGGFLSGVSTPELLAALAIPAGAALAYHGGRYTGPIGAGLAGFGGLGLALGQRQYNQQQRDQLQKQVASLSGMFPGDKQAKQFFDSAAGSGMTASEAFNAWQEKQHPKMSTIEEQIAAFNKDPKGFSAMESAMHPQHPSQGLHIPNPVQARAMQMGGLTDISQLATHPELINQAQQEAFRQQRQTAEDIAIAGRPPRAPDPTTPVNLGDVTEDPTRASKTNPNGRGMYFRDNRTGTMVWQDMPGVTPKTDQPSKKAVPKAHFPKEMQDAYVISDVPDLPGAQYLTPKSEGETVPGYSKYNPFGPTATAKFYYQGKEIKPTTTKDGKTFYKLPDGRNWMP